MFREEVAHCIVDSAIAIHTALEPGMLESVYQRCLMYESGFLPNWKVLRIKDKDGILYMI